jgi:hypothetical protein
MNTRVIKDAKQIDLFSWEVPRRASIFREYMEDGEVQYTVRVWDMERIVPFVTRSFATIESARSFVERIRKGTDRD